VVEHTMDVQDWLRKQLEDASPDLLRAMVKDFAEALMGAEADALCGAPYGERSPERVNRRNGYRERDWDTRVGSNHAQPADAGAEQRPVLRGDDGADRLRPARRGDGA